MKEKTHLFDFKQFEAAAIEQLRSGRPLEGKDGVLAPLIKHLFEASLSGGFDASPQADVFVNRRNSEGVEVFRDWNGNSDPGVFAKPQHVLGEALDHKVISMYSSGRSYSDICAHLETLYGLIVSPASLSAITDRVLDDVKAWQHRTLENVYAVVWLDAIYYKVMEEGNVQTKTVYYVTGLNCEGLKDLLGFYICEKECAAFWLEMLTDMRNRGVQDILVACSDNLNGFAAAMESIYPRTEVQRCFIHQIRNSIRFVISKDVREVLAAMKSVCQASTLEQAEQELFQLDKKWGEKYPAVIKSWNENWSRLSQCFKYPQEIRKILYTPNMIESFYNQLRKVVKTKRVFHSDNALLKISYLVFSGHRKGWVSPVMGWKQMYAQLNAFFGERFDK